MLKLFSLYFLALMGITFPLMNQLKPDKVNQRPELGNVRWNRDWAEAKKVSAETGKPLFVQFQEVPG